MGSVTQQTNVYRRGVRLVLRAVRYHPMRFVLSIVGTLLFAATAVLTTVVLGDITDEVLVPAFENDDVGAREALAAAAVLFGVAVARTIGVMMRRYYAGSFGSRTQRTLREELAERYVTMPPSDLRRQPIGELLSHADADAEIATNALNPLPFSVGVIALVVFSMVSMLAIDPVLLLIALVAFPLVAIANRLFTQRVERPAALVQEALGDVASIVHESVSGALIVKTLGRQEAESERLSAATERLRAARVGVGRLRARFDPTLNAIPDLSMVALVAVGAWLISDGRMTTGELVQVIALFQLLAFPLRVVGFLLEELPQSVVAADRIDRLLAGTGPDLGPARPQPLPEGPLAIEASGVSFSFGGSPPVLDRIDLDVHPGETLAIVGSTGTGKSTLCSLLAGLELPAGGRVEIGGVPTDVLDRRSRADSVTVVFQEPFLFSDTLAENIVLGRDVDESALKRALAIARVDHFLDDLPEGLDTEVGERGVTLSGGQRQRIALARGLVGQPRVLILDDATSAIDPTIEAEILDGLRSELRCTTVVVAQRLSTVTIADRVAFMAGGRVEAVGTHNELMRIPSYAELIRAYETNDNLAAP